MGQTKPRASQRRQLNLEVLESRELLAADPTVAEQVFLERLNDARANPPAYGQSIGLNLANVAASQPLAFNRNLIQAARDHSQDMNNRRFFAHTNPSGVNPGQRLQAAGFDWMGYGESLVAGVADPAGALRLLIIDEGVPDLGHRRHLLAIDSFYSSHTQVGIGGVLGGSGPYRDYFTIDSGYVRDNRPFLTGVVLNDANGNGQYDAGEGLGGVTITVAGVGAVTTFATGGYGIQLSPGTYTVTASGGGLGAAVTRTVTLGSTNVRMNWTPATTPPTPSIDYARAVQRLYQAALGRGASDAEVALWLPAMQQPNGTTQVANAIERSHEARTRLVKSWYSTYLGREASGSEEQGWVAALRAGITEEDILSGILGSAEYFSWAGTLLGTSASNETLVSVLFQRFLGRTPGAVEVASFVENFVALHGRTHAARVLLGSTEYRGNQVLSYYTNILGRTAPPGASEVAGWVNSGIDLCSIRIGFEGSREFLNP